MSRKKLCRRESDPNAHQPAAAPRADAIPTPLAHPQPSGKYFFLFALVALVAGAALTFNWMASPSDARFLGSGDGWHYYGPVLSYMDHSIHRGEFPLWNPLYFCGQPFAANPQSFLFYPPNLIRSLLTFNPVPIKTHTGIALLVMLQLLLGGMSAFFLARRHALSHGAALLATFAFAFSAPMVTRATGHWIFLNSVSWFPLTLLLLNHAFSERKWSRQLGFSIGASLSWAMTILGGVPFLIVLGGMTIILYSVLFRLLHEAAPREGRANDTSKHSRSSGWGRHAARSLLRDAAGLAVVLAGGLLIAAPLLLPGYEFSQHTERAIKTEDAHEDFAPVEAGWDFVRMLVVYQGHGHYEGIRSSGAIVFMLALAALLRRPTRNTLFFSALLAVLLDCSLSKPLLFGRLLNALAPFQMANPGRAMIVACLPLGLIAAVGADSVLKCQPLFRARLFRTGVLVAAGSFVVAVLALGGRPEPVLPVGHLPVAIPAVACLCAIAAVWFPQTTLWGSVIAMLVLCETLAWNRHLVPSVVPEENRYPHPMERLADTPVFWSGNQRGTDMLPNVKMYDLQGVMNGYDPMHLRDVRDVLCTTPVNKAFRRIIYAPEPTAYSNRGNLFLKRQFWLARQFVNAPLPDKNNSFPPTTTVFLNNPGPLPLPQLDLKELTRAAVSSDVQDIWLKPRGSAPTLLSSKDLTQGKNYVALKPLTLPPLHSALSLTLTASCPADLKVLFMDIKTSRTELGRIVRFQSASAQPRNLEIPLPDFQELQIVLMPDFKGNNGALAIHDAVVKADRADENNLISVASRTPNSVEIDLKELPGYRMLVNIDAFYPGWRACVDGEPSPIYRADGVFKAVVVPPGSHRVTFVFRPASVVIGILISVGTLLLFCAIWLYLLFRPVNGGGPD